MTTPSEPPVCPACGLVLPPGQAAGACPRCLLAAGMVASTGGAEPATEISSDVPGPAAAELTEGSVIDRYRIGRRIGRGGMGEVYAAEQIEPVTRPVAFKVIKRGMDTDQIIGRFQTERQALALMDHPNIAVVLDAGATPAGRPFFVMEFVQGVPLTTFCNDKNLPLRARLDLFLQVCGAIQHAHQKGIIHRDLKPSNILVGEEAGQPVPKVIDFGLAKATGQDATDRTLLTEAGQVLGTPAYMSPEQAAGSKDLDTRADLYALGAILYELITGEPPFDRRRLESAAWEEILRLIREEEPPRPSARLAHAHKHGEKHGTKRGERQGVPALAGSVGLRTGGSPNAGAHEPPKGGTPSTDETENTTSREPAKAGTPSIRGTRSTRGAPSKGATRSKGGTRSIPADLDWIVMKALEKDRARRYDTASALAGDVRHFLAHEPVNARPPTAGNRLSKFVRRHRRSLATAAVLTAGILSTAGVWAKSEFEKRQRAAQLSQQVLGLVAEAERLMQENDRADYDNDEPFRSALELTERAKALLGRESPVAIVAARLDPLLAAVRLEHDIRELIGELEEEAIASLDMSEENPRKSLSRYEGLLTVRGIEPGRLPVEVLTARWDRHREAIRSRLATGLEGWAGRLRGSVDPEWPGGHWLQQAVDEIVRNWLWNVVDAIDPHDVWRDQVRAASRAGDSEALGTLADRPERKRQPAVTLVRLALTLYQNAEWERSISILKEVVQTAPSNFTAHVALGNTMYRAALIENDPSPAARADTMGWTLMSNLLTPGQPHARRREYDEAIGHLITAVALRPESVAARHLLAQAVFEAGRIDEAIASFRKAAELRPDWAMAHHNLSHALLNTGDWDNALVAAREAIRLEPDLWLAHVGLSNALYYKDDWDGAITSARRAIELQPDLALAHVSLGAALYRKDDLDGAIAEARRAIELEPGLAVPYLNLGFALGATGGSSGAIAAARKAIELQPGIALSHLSLSAAHHNIGEWEAAIAEARRAIDLQPDLAEAHTQLSVSLFAKGDLDGAVAASRKAVELRPDLTDAHTELGRSLSAKGDLTGAVGEDLKSIELEPDLAVAHSNLSDSLFATGDMEGAIREARRAIGLEPDLAVAHMHLGNALDAIGDPDGAIAAFREAIKLNPDDVEIQHLIQYNLGIALLATGDWDGALAANRKAIDLKPESALAHQNLGWTLYAKGELEGAVAEARRATELQPDLVTPHHNLGAALVWSGSFAAGLDSFVRALASGQNRNPAQDGGRNVGSAETLTRLEAALIAELRASPVRSSSSAPGEHAEALEAIYRRLPPRPSPGAAVLHKYAESHPDEVKAGFERATFQMITIPKGRSGTSDPVRQRRLAAEVRKKAADGTDFGELATTHSTDSFASSGGRREVTRMGLKKLMSDAAFALKPGQISPVIEDEGNLYLIRMVERQAADLETVNLDAPEVRSAVAAMLESERREAWKEKFWRQCLEKARRGKD